MPQLLTLSRAARIAGVTRSELQKRLREANTDSFEGQIRISDLHALYPDVDLESDPVFERVQRIKSNARPKMEYTDGWMPDAEVLMTRLKQMNQVLVHTKAALYNREELLGEILERLIRLRDDAGTPGVRDLRQWLQQHLEAPVPERDHRAEIFARDAFYRVLAPSVHLLPGGEEFFVDGSDTILEAGLKAGLHLDYGCASGNCGACKCRVASGKVKQARPHDYVLSARERETGHILACSWTAVTDVVLEARVARAPGDLPAQAIRTEVARIERLAPDLALLQLRTPRTQTLRFMAGQCVDLRDESGNRALLPIASCPCDGRNLQFYIEDRADSPFSRGVFDGSLADSTVLLEGPEGDFVLREDTTCPALFIAVDSGFAPVRSMIEHAISMDRQESLTLFAAGWPERVPLVNNRCRAWRDALDNFYYHPLPGDTRPEVLVEQLASVVSESTACTIYVAGPATQAGFIAEELHRRLGIPEPQIQVWKSGQQAA